MKRQITIKLITLTLLLSALYISPSYSTEKSEHKFMRINSLIPADWIEYPAIDPAIPDNYIMKPLYESWGPVVWGPEERLENIDPDNLIDTAQGMFLVAHADTIQPGPNQWEKSAKETEELGLEMGFIEISVNDSFWGTYPLRILEGKFLDGSPRWMVWIGLNSPQGWVVKAQYIGTGNMEKDEKVWSDFINNTKQLTEQELFISKGIDMRDGYTYYTQAHSKVKAVAEKKGDGKLAVLVTPMDGHSTVEIKEVQEGYMNAKWKNGEPLTKIYGIINYNDGNSNTVINAAISVLTKITPEFSFDLDKDTHIEGTDIYTK